MEWISIISENVKSLSGLLALLSSIFGMVIWYSNRRTLGNKIDYIMEICGLFFLNFIIHSSFIFMLIFYNYSTDKQWLSIIGDNVLLLIILIFTFIFAIFIEIFFEKRLRISFTFFRINETSGLLLKQEVKESYRKIRYQVLEDKVEENNTNQFYKKINREIAFPITEAYNERHYFVSNIMYRLKNIKLLNGRFSLLHLVILRWILIIIIWVSGMIYILVFKNIDSWLLTIGVIINIITILKNILCLNLIDKSNFNLIATEFKNFSPNDN